MSTTTPDSPTPIDRRTVLKGAAWAVPVIVLTTAAPAAASSLNGATAGTPVASGGKNVTESVSVSSTQSVTIIATMTVTPAGSGTWQTPNANNQTTGSYSISQVFPAGSTQTFTFPTFQKGSSANDKVYYTITFTVNGAADPSLTRSGELRES